MLQKRLDGDTEEQQHSTVAFFETARAGTLPGTAAGKPAEKKEEEKISLFWRLFGGTVLSIAALVAITLYNNINGNINDLRAEVGREREARAGFVKKEEADARTKSQYERIRAVEGYRVDIEAVKERAAVAVAGVEAVKKETAGFELLKERVAAVETVKKDVAGIDALKEKLTAATADLKAFRDEVQKLQQELEKNKASDLERKAFRDAQARQLDETIKELQKGVQACREKIARLEGAQPNGTPVGKSRPESPPSDE